MIDRILGALVCPVCSSQLVGLYCDSPACGYKAKLRPSGAFDFIDAPIDAGFNARWAHFPKPQATTESVFWLKTGWSPEFLKGKLILDAGCGCGRFTQIGERSGAQMVALDGSGAAVDATRENAPEAVALHADLLHIPVKDNTFDAAFSIGVLHHTSDPEAAFKEVARTVKPGGELAVWLYAKPIEDPDLLRYTEFLHEVTKSVTPEVLYTACKKHAVHLRDASKRNPAVAAVARVFQISHSADNDECISDTFDWHTPQYRFWHTKEEVRAWFERAGFSVVWVGSYPVSMRGVKK